MRLVHFFNVVSILALSQTAWKPVAVRIWHEHRSSFRRAMAAGFLGGLVAHGFAIITLWPMSDAGLSIATCVMCLLDLPALVCMEQTESLLRYREVARYVYPFDVVIVLGVFGGCQWALIGAAAGAVGSAKNKNSN